MISMVRVAEMHSCKYKCLNSLPFIHTGSLQNDIILVYKVLGGNLVKNMT